MISARSQIIALIEKDAIPTKHLEQALLVSEVAPKGLAWHRFIDSLLLWLGYLALALAALFFIAYNWSELGRFAKFALVEALLILSIAAYWKWGENTRSGKLSLLMATLFLGVLLALYGQTYQTGADTWQLFFNWALLITPWVIISRFSVIWIVWLTLINLSVILYFQSSANIFWLMFSSDSSLLWALFGLNTVALVIWEYQQRQRLWLQDAWAIRLMAVASGVAITWLVLFAIFKDNTMTLFMHGLIWCAWVGAWYSFYRRLQPDLFMLAGMCLSGIVVCMMFFVKYLFSFNDAGSFFFIALLILALGGSAVTWLKKLHKEFQP